MNEDQKADLLDRLIESPEAREQLLSTAGATLAEREELLALADTADTMWLATRVPPPLDEDPIAAMLGVAPALAGTIDPLKFKAARARANVTVSQLRDRLLARGWAVTGPQIGSWQTQAGIEVLPAMLADISSALGVDVGAIAAVNEGGARSLHATLRSADWFQALVDRWQVAQGVIRAVAEAQLLSRATATVHRGEKPDVEQIHELLQQLVDAESERRSP